ncbi:MAG: hypothetical protein JXO22_03345 [Phycisphaerae bacterium]|nr:hypothetical protein [Phycisphaerae bacterium]
MAKLCPHVILEGTRLTLKTEIAFALNEHPRFVGPRKYRYHSPVVSGEWCGFTPTPWGRGLINFEPAEEELALATYETWVRLFEQLRYYSWIVDRFHISTQAYQRAVHGKSYDFGWLEERLAAIGYHLIFCTRTPASFAAAREERLKVSGNPGQYDDLTRFVDEQERMRELVRGSRLPVFEVDVSDSDVAAAAERIVDHMDEAGGLYVGVEEATKGKTKTKTQAKTKMGRGQ